MVFLYHLVPEGMKGNYLYPLNELKNKYPGVFKKNVERYRGRKSTTAKRLPVFNCKWNDVIHLVAVSPLKITKTLRDSGYNLKKLKWYKIPAKLLDPETSTIYLNKFKKDLTQITALDQFTRFSITKLLIYNKIPRRTIKYYKAEIREGRKPLMFHFIPHILCKDKLDISNCEIIES